LKGLLQLKFVDRTQLITRAVWSTLTDAARKSKKPAHVAVAYFGVGAANMLRLPPGSALVVDASEAAVKSGRTHPRELQLMRRRNIEAYSAPHLHAKVFVLEDALFIGSANASRHSASVLQEAVVRITQPTLVGNARAFVQSLCLEPLGPEELKRLRKLYRPPRFASGRRASNRAERALRVAQLKAVTYPEKLEEAFKAGQEQALKKKQNRRFDVEGFYWNGSHSPFRKGELVVQVLKDGRGRSVSPPGHVIHTRAYRNGAARKTLVYVSFRIKSGRRSADLARN
jgi:hypothetical protein